MNPPKACLRYFVDPLILSSHLISGRVKNEVGQSYGMIVNADEIPKEYLDSFLSLIDQRVFAVTQVCQILSKDRPKYLMSLSPKPDPILTTNQYLSLTQFIQKGQLQSNQDLFTKIFSQLLIQTNRIHKHSLVHGALCPSNIFFNLKTMQLIVGPPLGFSKPFVQQFAQLELEAITPPEVRLGHLNKISWQTDVYQIGYIGLCMALNKVLSVFEVNQFLTDSAYFEKLQRENILLTPAFTKVLLNLLQNEHKARPRPGVVLEVLQQNVDIQLKEIEYDLLDAKNYDDVDFHGKEERIKQTEKQIAEVNQQIQKMRQEVDDTRNDRLVKWPELPQQGESAPPKPKKHSKSAPKKQEEAVALAPQNSSEAFDSMASDKATEREILLQKLKTRKTDYQRVMKEYETFKESLKREERRKVAAAEVLSRGQPPRRNVSVPDLSLEVLSPELLREPAPVVQENYLELRLHRIAVPFASSQMCSVSASFATPFGSFEGVLQNVPLQKATAAGMSVDFSQLIRLRMKDADKIQGQWARGTLIVAAGPRLAEFKVALKAGEMAGPQWALSADGQCSIQYSVVW